MPHFLSEYHMCQNLNHYPSPLLEPLCTAELTTSQVCQVRDSAPGTENGILGGILTGCVSSEVVFWLASRLSLLQILKGDNSLAL